MISNKRILSVITARKGSKGIPGKNYRDLLGKPLFMWSVMASVSSKYVDKTIISSNCEQIERIYNEDKDLIKGITFFNISNCEFIRRPVEISGDLSKNEEALIHAINNEKEQFDVVINLQPTSPIRLEGLLDKCIEMYYNGNYDSLITAKKDTPFFWQKINGEWKYTVDKNHCCDRKMRQEFKDNEFTYHDCGSIYITDVDIMLRTKCRIGKKVAIFEVDRMNSLQIDEEFDFELIEQMAKVKGLDSLI